MNYEHMTRGIFSDRPNRFVAHVWLDGKLETVHVKNTGRCGELLIPGVPVSLQKCENPNRKTKYDLIGVCKESLGWVNLDSQAANKVVLEWLRKQDFTYIKPEYPFGNSRLDFYLEKDGEKYLMEVKGCNLEIDGKGYFPDAVSARAKKHELELAAAVKQGYHCITAFVIAMQGIDRVYPNVQKDPEFAKALAYAKTQGVEIWHFACDVTEDSIAIRSLYRETE